jgi:hypothetical protein
LKYKNNNRIRKNLMKNRLMITISMLALSVILTACSTASQITGGSNIPYASIPAGKAYSEGKEIFFSHTETSDPGVAEKLTNMMQSPVLVVPSLAEAPESMTAPVYVFTNGVKGKGPLGYQPDVFGYPPGTDGYTPLRKIVFVTWKNETDATLLTSLTEIQQGESAGKLTLETTDVVVNMPFMSWDGGKR